MSKKFPDHLNHIMDSEKLWDFSWGTIEGCLMRIAKSAKKSKSSAKKSKKSK